MGAPLPAGPVTCSGVNRATHLVCGCLQSPVWLPAVTAHSHDWSCVTPLCSPCCIMYQGALCMCVCVCTTRITHSGIILLIHTEFTLSTSMCVHCVQSSTMRVAACKPCVMLVCQCLLPSHTRSCGIPQNAPCSEYFKIFISLPAFTASHMLQLVQPK